MTSKVEKFGFALGKALKKTVDAAKEATEAVTNKDAPTPTQGPPMYRTNMRNVPKVEGLPREDGWVDMQVQFLIDKETAGADHVVGWTVLKPGARHERHRHRNCDEFFIVLKGKGHDVHDGRRYDWEAGDAMIVENACVHQHFSDEEDGECILLVMKAKPLFLFMHMLFQKVAEWPPKVPTEKQLTFVPPGDL